jgi:hypothetical protein
MSRRGGFEHLIKRPQNLTKPDIRADADERGIT